MTSSTLNESKQMIRPALALGIAGSLLLVLMVAYFLFAAAIPGLGFVRESCRQVEVVPTVALERGTAVPDCWLIR